jgi:hypothetical protein
MARVEGEDPAKTSFMMRYVFKQVRKMLGRDLTPQKIAARVPRVFWLGVLMEWHNKTRASVVEVRPPTDIKQASSCSRFTLSDGPEGVRHGREQSATSTGRD